MGTALFVSVDPAARPAPLVDQPCGMLRRPLGPENGREFPLTRLLPARYS
jgi:hypothetical protein